MTKTPNADALIVLKALEKESKSPIKQLSDLKITTQQDYELAGELLKGLKQLAANAEAREKVFTVPLAKLIEDVRSLFRPFRSSVTQVEADTKTKMLAFVKEQQAAEQKLLADFQAGKIKKVSTLVTKQKELAVSSSFSQVRKVWTAVEVDARKTPREYLVPDVAAIKAALKEGKQVAGWKFEQVESIAV
jgi:hypothetical protein